MGAIDCEQATARLAREAAGLPGRPATAAVDLFDALAEWPLEPGEPCQRMAFEWGLDFEDERVLWLTLAREVWWEGEELETVGLEVALDAPVRLPARDFFARGVPAGAEPDEDDLLSWPQLRNLAREQLRAIGVEAAPVRRVHNGLEGR
jgi:hypothetical protein